MNEKDKKDWNERQAVIQKKKRDEAKREQKKQNREGSRKW